MGPALTGRPPVFQTGVSTSFTTPAPECCSLLSAGKGWIGRAPRERLPARFLCCPEDIPKRYLAQAPKTSRFRLRPQPLKVRKIEKGVDNATPCLKSGLDRFSQKIQLFLSLICASSRPLGLPDFPSILIRKKSLCAVCATQVDSATSTRARTNRRELLRANIFLIFRAGPAAPAPAPRYCGGHAQITAGR